MRIVVDISEPYLRELDRLASREGRSRATIVQQAITDYLGRRARQALDEAFGLWSKHKIDGLALQEKIRNEWKGPGDL